MPESYRKFGYLADPLYLICVALYLANRLWIKPHCDFWFFHWYLNDLICVPFLLPPLLYFLSLVRLRKTEGPPDYWEIVVPLIMISFAFEVYFPNTERFRGVTFADPWDIVAYTVGAVVSGFFWSFWYRKIR
ncbi:MAG: hypothetical protein PHQ75_03615 [Thermoguttaceae bacterium]|nr:hypothetical protein [Thermoguttaceae bacterium]